MPEMPESPELPEPRAPGVIKWYKVYAGLLAAIYVILFLGGIVGLIFAVRAPSDFWTDADMPPVLFLGYLVFLILISLVLGAAYIAAFIIPRKPWAWIYHLVLICIGLSSPCFIPISVPLMIYWLRSDAQAYYGRK